MVLAGLCLSASAKQENVKSPDGSISVTVSENPLKMTVSRDGVLLYELRDVSMRINGKVLGGNTSLDEVSQKVVTETLKPAVPLKQSRIESTYTLAELKMKDCTMELRVLNNAVAYRFVTSMRGKVEVQEDNFTLIPAEGYTAHRQPTGGFVTSYEEPYRHQTQQEWRSDDRALSTIPLLLSGPNDSQLLVGETAVLDYPRTFLRPDGLGLSGIQPKAPAKWAPSGDRSENITEEANYIAKTEGKRAYPWRYVICTDSKGLVEQTVPLQLAEKPKGSVSWVKPGQMSWEWWNGAAPYGPDVTFRYGNNYDTYAYFVDFAAKYGVEYVLLDEGWAKDTRDPFKAKDEMRLQELIKYAKKKGVGIVLWLPWLTVEQHWDLFKTYESWGVKGVKIDFMDHSDQWMVNFFERVAEEAAKRKLIVDFHGAFTPSGLEYQYPNVVSYEGIRGLENMGGCSPDNTLYMPFVRNAVGAADFTPGAMLNYQPECYNGNRPVSGSIGTRCHQMALYVVLESGVQMLSDCPTRYYENDACTRYITSVPTTWDETRCLAAKAGQYVIVAKRSGKKWYIGGITNGTEREILVDLDFLSTGKHRLTAFQDGINADYQGMHYNRVEQAVTRTTQLTVNMKRNGGYAAIIE